MFPRRLTAALAMALTCACGAQTPEAPEPLEATILEAFTLAADPDPAADRIEAVFGSFADGIPAHLYDSLSALAEAIEPRIVAREQLPGLDRLVVDLEADLAGGGSGTYSFQLEPAADGGEAWRVTWFQGPGVAWPPQSTRGDGLSSSSGNQQAAGKP